METLAFLHLRRHHQGIYYYRTHRNHQVDFYVPSQQLAIQVTQEMSDEETRQRELRSLVEFSEERDEEPSLHIITLADKESISMDGVAIDVIPIYEWLLSSPSW